MREIADVAAVSWSAQTIVYRSTGIGYANGDLADVTAIRAAAESVIGFRPAQIDPLTNNSETGVSSGSSVESLNTTAIKQVRLCNVRVAPHQ
jgi:hypothetical protein